MTTNRFWTRNNRARSIRPPVRSIAAAGCLVLSGLASACASTSGPVAPQATPASAAPTTGSAAPIGISLPADVCARNPSDKVLAILGIPGPPISDPEMDARLHAARSTLPVHACGYYTHGNIVIVELTKGLDRASFEAQEAHARNVSGGVVTFDKTLDGVGDVAYTGHSSQTGAVAVSALFGDTHIVVTVAANGDVAKIADLVNVIFGELH